MFVTQFHYLLLFLTIISGGCQTDATLAVTRNRRQISGRQQTRRQPTRRCDQFVGRECIPLSQCPSLLQHSHNPNHDSRLLQQATCSFPGQRQQVCCERQSLLPPECGYTNDDFRIIGGEEVTFGAYPWIALLGYKTPPSPELEWTCGGTLINNHYILTAAHCMEHSRRPVLIRLGEHDTAKDRDCKPARFGLICTDNPQEFMPEEFIIHNNYFRTDQTVKNDIGLIRLRNPVTYTKYVKPICLPPANYDVRASSENRDAYVAGWGQTHTQTEHRKSVTTLQHVKVPYVSRDRCSKQFDVDDNQLCFGGVKGQDACAGDSGGPLILPEDSRGDGPPYILIGIVSYGRRCAAQDVPGVYTNVGNYRNWIEQTLRP